MGNGKMNKSGEMRIKLSPLMLFVLLLISALGMGFLTPYHDAIKICGPSAYLTAFAAFLLVLPALFLIFGLQRRFPEKNLLEAATATFGGGFGALLNLLFIAALIFQTFFVVRNTAELISTYSLNRTPLWAVIALIFTCSGFFAKNGLVGVSRMAGFVFIPAFLFRLFMLVFSIQGVKASHLLPVIAAQPYDYLKGGAPLVGVYVPWIIGLLFIYPLLSKPAKLKAIAGSLLGIQSVIIFCSIAIVVGIFGASGAQSYIWPVFEAIRRNNIPLLALNQVGLIFLIVWFTMFLTGLSFMLYLYASGIARQFKNLNYHWCLGGTILITALGTGLIPTAFCDIQVFIMLGRSALVIVYAYPLLIYGGALLRGKGNKAG